MNQAAAYYEGTEHSYRTLCPKLSGHMNMGIWPADTLCSAQEALIQKGLSRAFASGVSINSIVDAGSGWGGTRRLVNSIFPFASYTGVNVSQIQIEAARSHNALIKRTDYKHAAVEEFVRSEWQSGLFMSVEAAFHFENKASLFCDVSERTQSMLLFDICVADDDKVKQSSLLKPAIGQAWSVEDYRNELPRCGFKNVEIEDLSPLVFDGFRDYLRTVPLASYQGSAAVLRQFRLAFGRMAKLAEHGKLQYVQVWAER